MKINAPKYKKSKWVEVPNTPTNNNTGKTNPFNKAIKPLTISAIIGLLGILILHLIIQRQ